MYSIHRSIIPSHKKKFFIKRKDLNFIGFPKIHFPFLQRKNSNSNFNTIKDTQFIRKYHSNFGKIKNNSSNNLKINEKIIRNKQNSQNHINNLMKKNRNSAENIIENQNLDILENLNNISSYNSLLVLWNDFNVSEFFKNFFHIILNKLTEEEREDVCIKEIKELSELKNNITSLIKEIQFRKKSLERLFQLNNLLSKDLITEVDSPDNTIIKEISEQIVNLRMHSVNVCFKMKKIKNKIYEGFLYGKYDLDVISQKFGFDKDYLIKMKEEMNFLKKGKMKLYFNIGKNPDPFLTKASENFINSNNESSFCLIPMSKELEESIKQCNYFIYQELIYYQMNNNRMNNYLFSQAENANKDNQINEVNNESLSEKINNDKINMNNINYNDDNINNLESNIELNNKNNSYRLEKANKKEKDESLLFEENRINMNDILQEKTNKTNLNKLGSNSKNSDKKLDKLSDSQISKASYLTSNATKRGKSSNSYLTKNLKVMIYEGYIHYFEEKYFKEYFKKIPIQEIKMFNLKNQLFPKMLNGTVPFILLVKEEKYNINIFNKQVKEKENIYGCCSFNYIKQNNKLRIRIIHISSVADYNYNEYKDNLRIIYHRLLNYIINEFSFDEIYVEFSKNDSNEEIYNIFKELDFFEKSISISKNQTKSNGGEDISNNGQIQLNYLIYKNKNELNDYAKKALSSFYGNNLFYIFNSILLSNAEQEYNIDNYNGNIQLQKEMQNINNLKYKDSEIYINMSAINDLFQSNNIKNISKLYKRITSLDELMKIFLQNKIDKNEIPLSAAENRFNIVGFVLDKLINSILINSSKLLNNYNYFNADSFFDEISGVYYNFMKSTLIYKLYDENIQINFYIIVNEMFANFFIKFENQSIENELLNGQNLYSLINDIMKNLILNKKMKILKNKMIWIPCFHSYRHLKCLINNTSFTVHEYIQVSNKVINTYQRRKKEKAYELLFKNSLNSFLIEPDINHDIIIDNNFIFGIINNAEFFNKRNNNKTEIINEDKEKINLGYNSENKDDLSNNKINDKDLINLDEINDQEINNNNEKFPNIIFLNYIKKSDFITASK